MEQGHRMERGRMESSLRHLTPRILVVSFLAALIAWLDPVAAHECTSDYDCEYGQKCAKGPGQINGLCIQYRDKFGLPRDRSPSIDSFAPNDNFEGECETDYDCEYEERCHKKLRMCVLRSK
jgi:hypothetical protein